MTAFVPSRKFLVAAFLLAMTVATLACRSDCCRTAAWIPDFTIFYMSGLLLRNGQASDLSIRPFNPDQALCSRPFRSARCLYTPPSEALLFVPFTLLGYWPAYLLWNAFNLILLAVSVVL